MLAALWGIAPKFISFAISFFTVAIFWVNHHHFFHRITDCDWKLLWFNNFLLFWLSVVPFTTAFIGDYPTQPLVVSLYAFTLAMAGLSFTLMGYYVFFIGKLVADSVSLNERRREWYRSWVGTGLYGLASAVALLYVYAALVIVAIIPFTHGGARGAEFAAARGRVTNSTQIAINRPRMEAYSREHFRAYFRVRRAARPAPA
ncbi:MAG: TMEM175 family protein [Anaerolineales bacterium]